MEHIVIHQVLDTVSCVQKGIGEKLCLGQDSSMCLLVSCFHNKVYVILLKEIVAFMFHKMNQIHATFTVMFVK